MLKEMIKIDELDTDQKYDIEDYLDYHGLIECYVHIHDDGLAQCFEDKPRFLETFRYTLL